MWQEKNNQLVRKFEFENFKGALDFVNKVGELAENANHHPEIDFGWGYAKITLSTHSEGGVTDKDHQLADQIDKLNHKD